MEELSKETKMLIEVELYREVILCIESYYDYKRSEELTKLKEKEIPILKNKLELSKKVVEIIKRFAIEKELDICLVKDYLLNMIEIETEKRLEKNNRNDWEGIEAIGIISLNESEFEER